MLLFIGILSVLILGIIVRALMLSSKAKRLAAQLRVPVLCGVPLPAVNDGRWCRDTKFYAAWNDAQMEMRLGEVVVYWCCDVTRSGDIHVGRLRLGAWPEYADAVRRGLMPRELMAKEEARRQELRKIKEKVFASIENADWPTEEPSS
jgi:hypothetical protein